ncbi:MAG: transporter [Peptococcaceae bacterium BICA1-8]|nr:MAG: transporter [Peptococcaceae bacterium BICA1-8]
MKKVKIKKDQSAYFWFFSFFALILLFFFGITSPYLGVYWLFGILFGFVLQKSRFCFVAAFRDPIIAGSTSLFRAVLVAMAIMTVSFTLIQYNAIQGGAIAIPGRISPVGVHTIAGGFIFGIGMVIAGGCATGTLMRIGEGFLMQGIVLVGFLIGTLWGAWDYPWWERVFISKSPTVHLAQYFGWTGAVLFQLVLIAVLYYIAKKYDDQNNILL